MSNSLDTPVEKRAHDMKIFTFFIEQIQWYLPSFESMVSNMNIFTLRQPLSLSKHIEVHSFLLLLYLCLLFLYCFSSSQVLSPSCLFISTRESGGYTHVAFFLYQLFDLIDYQVLSNSQFVDFAKFSQIRNNFQH